MSDMLDIADRDEADRQSAKDAQPVRCAWCGTELAHRYDIAPNSGIERYDRAFCGDSCADEFAADKYDLMWANGDVPEGYE